MRTSGGFHGTAATEEPDIFGNAGHAGVMPEPPESCGVAMPALDGTSPPSDKPCRIPPEARLRGARKGALVAAQRRREDAEFWIETWPLWTIAVELRAEGLSLARIADEFSRDGYETPQGKTRWHPAQVAR